MIEVQKIERNRGDKTWFHVPENCHAVIESSGKFEAIKLNENTHISTSGNLTIVCGANTEEEAIQQAKFYENEYT